MVKHIILWKLSDNAPAEAKAEVKSRLEALNGKGEVRVGQNIKIPQLKLKKAKK